MKTLTSCLAVAFLFANSMVANAEEKNDWSLSRLNPFAKKEEAHPLPKWVPPQQLPKAQAKPTTWNRVSNGWHKIVDFVNPFDDANDKPATPKNISQQKRASASTATKSGAGSNPKGPNSVQDFLSQPRPGSD